MFSFIRLPRSGIVPLIVSCALFMETLDSSIISTALPSIAQALQTDPLHLNLAITTYLLGLALFIPLSGWMADHFGARTIFRAAIVLFMFSSVLCGLSQNLASLVAARLLQGIGGAMMVPVGRLVLLKTVPKKDLVNALAWLTIPALVGPVVGPPLGGFIVTYWSWRWIFFLNIPVGLLGIFLVTLYIENIHGEERTPLDLTGFLLMSLSLASLLFGFETAGRHMIPFWLDATLLATGLTLLALYLRHTHRTKHPIIDLTLFRIPTFFAAQAGGTLFRIGVGALPFLLPMLLQIGFGLTPIASGLLTFASAAGALVMKTLAQTIIRRWGFRNVLSLNALFSSVFLGVYAFFRPDTPSLVIFGLLLLGGFFRSLQFTGLNALAFADIPKSRMSAATTLAGMLQQFAPSLGIATGAFVLNIKIRLSGDAALGAEDFWPAFATIGLLSSLSFIFFMRLKKDAGAAVSGHLPEAS